MPKERYEPTIAIHPGKTLQGILESTSMTQKELATRTNLTPKTVNEIVQGKNPLTPETAIKLSAVFGMSVSFWINLERNYQETCTRLAIEENLEHEIPLLGKFSCYNELVKWKYIPSASFQKEKILNLLKFFGVSSLELVEETQEVAFRKSQKKKKIIKESLAAWLRCGEIEAQSIETKYFDRQGLNNAIGKLRKLTYEKPHDFCKQMVDICAKFGVAVVFVPYFKNTHVNGATRWISSDKAIIQLSLRGKYDDIFWFTFLHELAHILKHGKKDQFIEFEDGINSQNKRTKEVEADIFATNTLIPKKDFDQFIDCGNFSNVAVKSFAKNIDIAPSIVAGRLSHEYKDWKKWSHLRKKLKFVEKH